MITTLLILLVVALVLVVIHYIAGLFVQGRVLQIIGAILALVWVLYALRTFNIINL